MSSRASARSKEFKSTVSINSERNRRTQQQVQIRKDKREQGLQKRRRAAAWTSKAEESAKPAAGFTKVPAELSVAHLSAYIAAILSDDQVAIYEGCVSVRKLLSRPDCPPVKEVIEAGVLPRLVSLLTSTDDKIIFESAWALTNVASSDHTTAIVDAGALPAIVDLLRSANSEIRDQCIWCLGNVAGDGPALRDMLLSNPATLESVLLNIQNPASISLLRNATWVLSNLCRGKSPSVNMESIRPALPALAWLLHESEDAEVLTDTCWALSYLTDGEDSRIAEVVALNVVPKLVALLSHDNSAVVTPALRTIGNIVTGEDALTQCAIDAGCFTPFCSLLTHTKRNIRREVCWSLSNIGAGTTAQIDSMLAVEGMMEDIIDKVKHDEWNIRKEATWVISNIATTGTTQHTRNLIRRRAVEAVCSVLSVQDTRVVRVALDALIAFLKVSEQFEMNVRVEIEECGGLDSLVELQDSSVHAIADKVTDMLRDHFDGDSEDESTDEELDDDDNTFAVENRQQHGISFGNIMAVGKMASPQKQLGGFGAAPPAQPMAQQFNFGGMQFS